MVLSFFSVIEVFLYRLIMELGIEFGVGIRGE